MVSLHEEEKEEPTMMEDKRNHERGAEAPHSSEPTSHW